MFDFDQKYSSKWFAIVLMMVAFFSSASALAGTHQKLDLAAPFQDHAVLQRGVKVPVWGWSRPGAIVNVIFGEAALSTKADKDGRWRVDLPVMPASAVPRALKVTDDFGGELVVEDVLVGEVWVAAGQSNMQWLASKCDVGRVLQLGIKNRVAAGEELEPIIREAKVTDYYSALHPIERAQAQWITDGSEMSAVAYAFAYELYKELRVPIGILNCSFSSTQIEAWIPREGFQGSESAYIKSIEQELELTDPSTQVHVKAWQAYYNSIEQAIAENDQRVADGKEPLEIHVLPPGNVRDNRAATWLYNARMHPLVPYAIRGAIWNQGYANMGAGITYYDNLHSLARGWRLVWQQPELPIYFNQFYSPGNPDTANYPSFGSTAEMRLGTYLARDIPHTGMASQIDIGGSVHYYRKALAGQRLALHALKHQYGKDVIVDGPMFHSYTIEGNRVIVSFDHAEGGLVVGQVEGDDKKPGVPIEIAGDASNIGLFYIADSDRVWHRATAKIVGSKVILTADGVDQPRGVSYGTGGVGFQPNLYNRAMLPMTPFAFYDNELVLRETWPDDPPRIAGIEPDPNAGGLAYEYRKFPILSTQFRDAAVLQHGVPVTIWGAAVRQYFPNAPGEHVIRFSFGGVEKTIRVEPGMEEWSVTLDPMRPSSEPKTMRVLLEIDGEVVHERVVNGIVVGDVWYVAMPSVLAKLPPVEAQEGIVRVMRRQAKRDRSIRPSRFSVATSTTPDNRFASSWVDAQVKTLEGAIAHRIAARSGGIPVGVILMQTSRTNNEQDVPLKSWIPFWSLKDAPSLSDDFAKLGTLYPGAPTYNDNIRRYINDWKSYWGSYIPEMIATRSVPDQSPWGVIPSSQAPDSIAEATQAYNVMVHSFTPAALKGVLFISGPSMVWQDEGRDFSEQMSVLGNAWQKRFAGNPVFVFSTPGPEDAPRIQPVTGIDGPHAAVTSRWMIDERSGLPVADDQWLKMLDEMIDAVLAK